jgi:hypothetical protein
MAYLIPFISCEMNVPVYTHRFSPFKSSLETIQSHKVSLPLLEYSMMSHGLFSTVSTIILNDTFLIVLETSFARSRCVFISFFSFPFVLNVDV